MENRAISISLAVSIATYFFSKLLLKACAALQQGIESQVAEPFIGVLHQSINNLPWLVGGATVGCLCNYKPIKHGAIAGAIYGIVFGFAGMVMLSAQTYEAPDKISQISYAAVFSGKCSFLFALSSAFGFLLATRRKVL